MHATKYMEWKLDYDSVDEPIAYNVYITLLSKDEEREEELVEYLKRTTTARFDMDFALRLFHKRGLKRATIQMYALMELFDSSVDLAIESGDLDLATVYADKPADDPILRKKLWLRIAKVIVQDRRDIKRCVFGCLYYLTKLNHSVRCSSSKDQMCCSWKTYFHSSLRSK